MQEPLRIIVVEQGDIEHGIAAQLLTDHNLGFSRQCAASRLELSKIAEDFKPHIVLCTDDGSVNARLSLQGALRLLSSQTPIILVTGLRETDAAAALGTNHSTSDTRSSLIPQDSADLRQGFCAVLESSAAPAVICDADGWITHANTEACRLLQSCKRSLVTVLSAAHDQCPPPPHWLPASHERGQDRQTAIRASMEKGSERSQCRLGYFDSWSILPTLVHMDELIGRLTAHEREYRAALAVIAVDPQGVRIPGEMSGCAAWDRRVPDACADTPTEAARLGSIIRISSDNSLVVLAAPSRPLEAITAVQRVLDLIGQAHSAVEPAHPTGELGRSVAYPPPRPQRPPSLQPSTSTEVRRTEPPRLRAELDDAIQRHALSVHYQPQFDVKTGRGCGVEALARWVLCSGESIAPSVFIPVAERSGLIQALGAWILKSACETAYSWCSRDAQRTTLSVNVSALQIDEDFAAVVGRALEKSGFPAKQLELEITESALIANPDLTIEYLKQWKQLGIRIAMDDFGTGYSSLSYLSRLPVDRLKLDQSLIHRMTLDAKAAAVTRLIVSLGAELGIEVIAEGVETEQQLQMLTDWNCPRVQGYLFGRPMPAKQAQLALRKPWGNRAQASERPVPAAAVVSYA